MKEFDLHDLYASFIEIIEDIIILEEEPGLVKAKIIFKDKTTLRVFQNVRGDKYSFFWLDKNDKLITGWDNAPHHPKTSRFPYHKHQGNKVMPSQERNLTQVLRFIEKKMIKSFKFLSVSQRGKMGV